MLAEILCICEKTKCIVYYTVQTHIPHHVMKHNMSNREVSIGICGAIVGVVLGAGSVVYSQDVSGSLMGSVSQEFEQAYRKRALSAVANAPVELTKEEERECYTRVWIAEELRDDVIPLLPSRPVDEIVKRAVHDAFDDYTATCASVRPSVLDAMRPQETLHTAAPAEEKPTVDASHCEGLTGPRYTSCLGAVRDNILYQPN